MTMSESRDDDAMTIHRRSHQAKEYAEEHWNRAAAVLSARPSLMTSHILLLALKNRPPAHVVEYMLSINPHAADMPSKGPTALQVAVRHNASVDVCRLVLQACPLALVASHSGYDPLMYAKIWRREEPELIELLSQPLSSLIEPTSSSSSVKVIEMAKRELPAIESDEVISPESSSPTRHSLPSTTTKTSKKSRSPTFVIDAKNAAAQDEEFKNIKIIAATIVRAQKRQTQAMQVHKNHVQTSLDDFESSQCQERAKQLLEMEQMQDRHFRTQLIALDMKEKAMMAKVKAMERRMNKTLELSKQIRSVKERRQDANLQRMESGFKAMQTTSSRFQATTEKRLDHVELRLEQECRVNDYFRNDTRLQLDQLDYRVHVEPAAVNATPIVYATPYVKDDDDEDDESVDSVMPLFGGKARRKWYPRRRRRSHLGLIHI